MPGFCRPGHKYSFSCQPQNTCNTDSAEPNSEGTLVTADLVSLTDMLGSVLVIGVTKVSPSGVLVWSVKPIKSISFNGIMTDFGTLIMNSKGPSSSQRAVERCSSNFCSELAHNYGHVVQVNKNLNTSAR